MLETTPCFSNNFLTLCSIFLEYIVWENSSPALQTGVSVLLFCKVLVGKTASVKM